MGKVVHLWPRVPRKRAVVVRFSDDDEVEIVVGYGPAQNMLRMSLAEARFVAEALRSVLPGGARG